MIKLTDLLNEGLGPSPSMIKKIEDFLKKELKVSVVKGKKYSQGRARQGYTFYPEGTKNGLYIDQAWSGEWNIYTVGANGFPIDNHWQIKKYEDDIEDEATALNAAFDVIKKFGKTLKESVNEETFTAINKVSGKVSVFKSKDARDAAVKAGTHSKEDEKDGGDEPKGEKKPNMFSKDAGYDAPDTDKSQSPEKRYGKNDSTKVITDFAAGKLSFDDLEKVVKHHDMGGSINVMDLDRTLTSPQTQDALKKAADSVGMSVDDFKQKISDLRDKLKDKEEPAKSDDTPSIDLSPSKYDSEYFADDEKSDSSPMGGYDDDDDYYYDDDEVDGTKLTSDRLDKIETALYDELKLKDNGFATGRESGGGGGSFEGPLTIFADGADFDENFVQLSIGSGENNGNFSIVFSDVDGMPLFEPNYDALTGNRELSAEESFKLGKALMKMPEVQKFIKGEISKEEFEPIYNKLKAKFSKSSNEGTIKLMNLLRK